MAPIRGTRPLKTARVIDIDDLLREIDIPAAEKQRIDRIVRAGSNGNRRRRSAGRAPAARER